MAEGDRAAVDVDAIHVGVVLTPPRGDDGREGLVDLDQVDVVDLHAVAGEEFVVAGIGPSSIFTGSQPTAV